MTSRPAAESLRVHVASPYVPLLTILTETGATLVDVMPDGCVVLGPAVTALDDVSRALWQAVRDLAGLEPQP